MDITNYIWISTFDPNKVVQTPSPSNSPQQPSPNSQLSQNNDNKTVIILASLFGVSGAVIILVCGFFIFRWFRKNRKVPDFHVTADDDLPGFPGSADSNHRNRSISKVADTQVLICE